MKTKLLLLAVSIAAFSSCSTMYKTVQTPDDVYYSPVRSYEEGYHQNNKDVGSREPANNYYNSEDRAIRMGISNYRYRYLNNDFAYSPYSFYERPSYFGNYYSGNYYNTSYGHSYYNDYYYNPYYNAYPVYVTPVSHIKNSTPRMTNLNGYTNNYNNNNSPLMSKPAARPITTPTSRTSSLGNILNKVFAPSVNNSNNNNNNTSNKNTERTYTPPPANNNSSSSGSSSSGSSGGSRITRPN